MNVILCDNSHEELWTGFLSTHNPGYHAFSWAWRDVIARTFGHTPCYLLALSPNGAGAEDVYGVLPLFLLRGPLVGTALVSVPYLNGGGIFSLSSAATQSLVRSADSLATAYGASRIELRHREHLPEGLVCCDDGAAPAPGKRGLVERSHKSSVVRNLPSSSDELFAEFPGKLRSQIRRPTKDGAIAETCLGDSREADKAVRDFYGVFAENMRELGTPVYPMGLFSRTVRAFGSGAAVHLVRMKGTTVAAGITVTAGGRTEIPWASSLREWSKSAPNMLLYWEALQHAISQKSDSFDFGRSTPGSGPFQFKLQWGGTPFPLRWHYHILSGSVPDISPHNDSFSLAIKAWKKLPLAATKVLGPYLTRWLP